MLPEPGAVRELGGCRPRSPPTMDLPPSGRGFVQVDSEWEEGVRSGQVAAWEVCREEAGARLTETNGNCTGGL